MSPEQFEHEARCADVIHALEAPEVTDPLAYQRGQTLLERALKRGELLFSELEARCLAQLSFAQLVGQWRAVVTGQLAGCELPGE
jgi:hypothetical protein